MAIEYWFPTVTLNHQVSANVESATKQKIDVWISSQAHTTYLELCSQDNLTTSYFKWHDTLGDLNLTELKEEILTQAVQYASQYGITVVKDDLRVDSWINFFYPGQSEQQHNHYGNFISGVYYISAPANSGVYRFYDPAHQKTMWAGIYLKNNTSNIVNMNSGQYVAEPGKMIMFPAWLEHAVFTNKSDSVRISLAFNINFKNGIQL
jgi:uncharacterized protein (TIGR02466 family)